METTKSNIIELAAKNALDAIREYNNLLIDCYCEVKPQDNCYLEILSRRLDLISSICCMLDTPNPFDKCATRL